MTAGCSGARGRAAGAALGAIVLLGGAAAGVPSPLATGQETAPEYRADRASPPPAGEAASVYCPACGAANRHRSRFCLKDGSPLPTLDPRRYVQLFARAPETFSSEEIQTRLGELSRSIVRIRVKTTTPLRIPVVAPDQGGGFEFYRPGAWRVMVGRLETLEESQFAGSGFVISPSGEVVTNAHVAAPFGMQGQISVEGRDGRSFPARLAGLDRATDLALLSVPGLAQPPLKWGDSDRVRLGEVTWAIGNPLDMGISVTRGTIATRLRTRPGFVQVEAYLHSDAYITHGNSGGPLINALGEVVGVSDLGIGAAKGNGYFIGANLARRVIDRLREHGKYERGYLGLHVALVDASSIKRYALRVRKGLVVESILPGSPAEQAGFRRGDVLFGINDRQATSAYVFQEAVSSVGPGVALKINLSRNDQTVVLPVTTALRPQEPRIDPITALEERMFVRFEEDPKSKKVFVRVPDDFSPSPRHGFLEGSVIESVVPAQDWPEEPLVIFNYRQKARPIAVRSLTELREALRRAYLGDRFGVAFEIRRPKDPIAAVAFEETWPIVI
jgi:S1-C subfamily serine protease